MRLIEYAIETNPNEFSPSVILLDSNDISTFYKLPNVDNKCKLITKHNQEYIVYGNYRTLTNRFFYALTKKHNIYEDDTMRPSIRIYHRPELLEPDSSFFDLTQLKAFIFGLVPDFDVRKLPFDTQDLLNAEK